jgi:uncharacterized membrane protein
MAQDPNNPYGQSGSTPPPPPEYQSGYQGGPSGYQQPGAEYPQQGGYQQQQQQPPYGAPQYGAPQFGQYNTAHPNGATSTSLDANISSVIAYLGSWVTGLIFILIEKRNRFVRFNAMQSILLGATLIVGRIVLGIILGWLLGGLIPWAFTVGGFVLWIFMMYQSYQGRYYKLPIIGDYAERFANQSTPTVY